MKKKFNTMTILSVTGVVSIMTIALFALESCTKNTAEKSKDTTLDLRDAAAAVGKSGTSAKTVSNTTSSSSSANSVFEVVSVSQSQPNRIPNISWKDATGAEQTLAKVAANKVLFLNIWATWCGPCKREIPDIIELLSMYKPEDLVIVGVSMDENTADVKKYVSAKNIPYINITKSSSIGIEKIGAAFGQIEAFPTTIIYDRKGMQKQFIVGANSKDFFSTMIKKEL